MKAELGNLGAYEFAAGVNAGEMSVNIATTTPEVFAYSSATYMGCDNNPQMYNDNGIIYFASIHTYSFSGEGGGKWDNSNLALDIGGGIYGALESASRTGDKWLGLNGKYYNNKWQGNQHTGGRSGAFKAASSYKWAGRAVVGVSAIIGVAATYDGYQMDGGQFGYNAQSAAAQTVGGIGGSIGGAALGAQIGGAFGALFGGVGAIPGAVIGGFIGGYFGGALGNSAGQATVNLYHHK